jgi:MrcB-like, N-terminal domain
MRDELLEVIALQREYSSKNSPAMQRRGLLIRTAIPQELRSASTRLKAALGIHGEDLAFQGRDGTGRKTLIPWVRFFSRSRSPSAQRGWYCVYLFDAPGTGVYLELGHGSTNLIEGEYRPRSPEELARLVGWGSQILAPIIQSDPVLAQPMVLQGQDLGDAYQRSAVLTKWYPATNLPSDEVLFDDAVGFAGHLKRIYDAEALGLAPSTPPPEVLEVEAVAAGQPERRGLVRALDCLLLNVAFSRCTQCVSRRNTLSAFNGVLGT